MPEFRLPVRVKPGASRAKVAGRYGEDELVVAVNAPPVDGAANEAVVRAVAKALQIRPREVTIASGHTARTKVLVLHLEAGDVNRIRETVKRLLDAH